MMNTKIDNKIKKLEKKLYNKYPLGWNNIFLFRHEKNELLNILDNLVYLKVKRDLYK